MQERATAAPVRGLVELVVLAGFYQMFSVVSQGFAVSLPSVV
jgi:hypothetical protein